MNRTAQAICVLAPCVLTPLSACQTVSLAQAEQTCIGEARQAQFQSQYPYANPTGSLDIGVGSGGYSGVGIGLNFSPGMFLPRNPDTVYANCVRNQSGFYPTRPYSSLPESRMYRPYP